MTDREHVPPHQTAFPKPQPDRAASPRAREPRRPAISHGLNPDQSQRGRDPGRARAGDCRCPGNRHNARAEPTDRPILSQGRPRPQRILSVTSPTGRRSEMNCCSPDARPASRACRGSHLPLDRRPHPALKPANLVHAAQIHLKSNVNHTCSMSTCSRS